MKTGLYDTVMEFAKAVKTAEIRLLDGEGREATNMLFLPEYLGIPLCKGESVMLMFEHCLVSAMEQHDLPPEKLEFGVCKKNGEFSGYTIGKDLARGINIRAIDDMLTGLVDYLFSDITALITKTGEESARGYVRYFDDAETAKGYINLVNIFSIFHLQREFGENDNEVVKNEPGGKFSVTIPRGVMDIIALGEGRRIGGQEAERYLN